MAVRIRLLRMGKIRKPQYRIVVADARRKRDGRTIENLGIYHPKEDPSRIEVDSERVQYWLSVGAQPSEPVQAILRKTGDWQQFRGLPQPQEPLKQPSTKRDQHAVYEAEAKAAKGVADAPDKGEATTPKKSKKAAASSESSETSASSAAESSPATEAESADAAAGATSEDVSREQS